MEKWTKEGLEALKELCGCFAGFHSPEAAWEARALLLRGHCGLDVTGEECAEAAAARGWSAR